MRQIAESWELATAVCCSSTCFQKEKVHLQKPEVIILESVYIWNGKALFKIKAQEVQQRKGAGRGCRGCVSCSTVCPLALFKPCPHPCSETGANSSKAASWSPDQHDLEELSQPKLHEGISKPHQTNSGWLSSSKSCFQKKAPLSAVLLTGVWWKALGFVWFLHEVAKRSSQFFLFSSLLNC